MLTLLGFIEGLFSPTHMIILLIIGILIFGKRLPEMGRYLGKGIVEFSPELARRQTRQQRFNFSRDLGQIFSEDLI